MMNLIAGYKQHYKALIFRASHCNRAAWCNYSWFCGYPDDRASQY